MQFNPSTVLDIFKNPSLSKPRIFWFLYIVCTLLTLLIIWLPKYLPMVDLPEHAAIASILANYDSSEFSYSEIFEINYFVPYLTCYLSILFFNSFLPIFFAVKLTISIAILLLSLSMLSLTRCFSTDPWLAFFSFPIAFNFAFYWGLLGFIFALPFAIFLVEVSYKLTTQESTKHSILFVFLSVFLFFTHLVAFALAMFISVLILASRGYRVRQLIKKSSIILVPALLALYWTANSNDNNILNPSFQWDFSLTRIFEILGSQIGYSDYSEDSSASSIMFIFLVLFFACYRGHCSKKLIDWIPFVTVTSLAAFGPTTVSKIFFSSRAAIFILPFLITVLRPPDDQLRKNLGRFVVFAFAFFWLLGLGMRFVEFDKEARDFDKVMENALPGKNLVGLMFDNTSKAISGYPYLNFQSWYQAFNLGESTAKFVKLYNYYPLKYVASENIYIDDPWDPHSIDWNKKGDYDYLLIREKSSSDTTAFTNRIPYPVTKIAQEGQWVLYRR